jgi:hypothetical protein
MFNSEDLREGMVVQTADGEKLGKVLSLDVTHFQVGKGLLFKEDYAVSYDDIREIRGGLIVLAQDQEHFLDQPLWPKTPVGSMRDDVTVRDDEEDPIRNPVRPIEPPRGNQPASHPEPGVVHIGRPGRSPKEG